MNNESDALGVLAELWRWAGEDPAALDSTRLTGGDPVLPSNFKIATAATASIAAAGLAAAELWRLRGGRRQRVAVDARAAAAAFRSERYLRVDGRQPPGAWHPVSGFYRAGDGRWIQLHCNFPHHRDGVLRVLGCDGTREAVTAAVAGWKAAELEDALAAAGLCAGMVRAPDEWQLHSQAQAVAELPLFEIVQIGEAPAEAPGSGDRPLSGVRVLDLTRVIAGPVCGRTLAEHGADVLLVTAEHLPSIEVHVMDFGHGKRSARLDLRRADHAERLRSLIRSCDVICQSYRPGALVARRARRGGSYLVRFSLAQTGRWIDRLGRVAGLGVPDPRVEVDEFLQTSETPFGVLRHVAPAAKLSETPACWACPSVPLGTHAPEWRT